MSLAQGFEAIKQLHNGVELWSAREIMPLMGYTNWNKFQLSIEKAKESMKVSGNLVSDHFYPEVKLIQPFNRKSKHQSNL